MAPWDRALYPFESRWLQRGNLRMHYLDEGRGAPLLCVHGNPTWSFYFRSIVREFRATHRVIAPDHIGMGLSDKPDDAGYAYTFKSRVDDLCALVEQLDLRGLTLVLHDWGGMIGMAAAARLPERIARLVLLNTAAFRLPTGRRLPLRLRLIRDGGPLAAVLVRGMNAFARGATTMAVRRPLPADVKAAYLAPYDSWANRIATLRFVEDIPLSPGDPAYELVCATEAALPRFAALPTLICWGRHDFVFDGAFLAEWRRRFPQAEVHEFPDAGHYLLEDAGAEVIPLLKSFLARHALQA